MPTLPTIFAFATTSVVLAFIPGPDNLFVMTQAALRGWRTGVIVTLGLCTGLVVHTTAVAFGLAALFQQSETAFTTLKFLGAAYLIYLAYGAFRAKPAEITPQEGIACRYRQMYLRGIFMNITNPKIAVFFLAFLPQFVSVQAGNVTLQTFVLGALFIAATIVSFSTIAISAAAISKCLLRSARVQAVMNQMAGAIFLGLAAKLATSHR